MEVLQGHIRSTSSQPETMHRPSYFCFQSLRQRSDELSLPWEGISLPSGSNAQDSSSSPPLLQRQGCPTGFSCLSSSHVAFMRVGFAARVFNITLKTNNIFQDLFCQAFIRIKRPDVFTKIQCDL